MYSIYARVSRVFTVAALSRKLAVLLTESLVPALTTTDFLLVLWYQSMNPRVTVRCVLQIPYQGH